MSASHSTASTIHTVSYLVSTFDLCSRQHKFNQTYIYKNLVFNIILATLTFEVNEPNTIPTIHSSNITRIAKKNGQQNNGL